MRYIKARIKNAEGPPTFVRLVEKEPSISFERIDNMSLMGDSTLVLLGQFDGEPERIRELAETTPSVLDYEVVSGQDGVSVYVQQEISETQAQLLSMIWESELLLQTPLVPLDDGGLQVQIVGPDEAISEMNAVASDLVSVHVEELSDYVPEDRRLYASLTDRQQETLQKAVELGYYQIPREATQEDIAAELDLSNGTVGDHLRKIEVALVDWAMP